MRIAYLSYCHIPSRRAASVHVMRMCQALAREGHQVTLYGQAGQENAGDIYAYYQVANCFDVVQCPAPGCLPSALRGAVFTLSTLSRMLAGPRPDLLYGRLYTTVSLLSMTGIPVAFEAHGPPDDRTMAAALGRLFRRKNFRKLVVISGGLRDLYAEAYPDLPADRIVVCHDGADPVADGAAAESDAFRQGQTDGFRAGYVGSLYPGRGIDLIVDLARRLPDIDFHVAGGEEADIAHWRDAASDVGNLHLHGFLPPRATDAFRMAMDVLLAPYQENTTAVAGRHRVTTKFMSPLKVFEYMASGRPIVCSDLPILREVLQDGRNALLVAPCDPEAWVHAIQRLRDDPAQAGVLGARAQEDFLREYTWQGRAGRILRVVLES